MRVGMVADKLNVSQGGSNFSLELISRTLVERGHDVSVLTVNFAHENDLPDDPPFEVIEAPVDGGSRVGDAKEVYDTLVSYEDRFDIYHVFNPALHPVAGAYRRRHDTPVVGRLNTYDIFCTNLALMDGTCHEHCTVGRKFVHDDRSTSTRVQNVPKYTFDTFALPRLLNEMDGLFALSPQVSSIYQAIGVEEDQLALVPNFYDPAFGTDNDEERDFPGGQSLLYVGTLKPHKGVDLLVESATDLPEGTSVEIVGGGPQREALEAQAERLDVADIVTFHGWVDHADLAPFYRGADVFVHPGLWPEPFNRTVLEAMQCDCPLVVSDIGAPPWVVDDCGEVFDRGDAAHLAEVLSDLLTDPDHLEACRWRCPERLAEFAPERSVSLLEEQYESCL